MALTLPYPNMDFTPLDILTADEMDQLVANIEFISQQFPIVSGNINWDSYYYKAGDVVNYRDTNILVAGRERQSSGQKEVVCAIELEKPVAPSVTSVTFTQVGYVEAFDETGVVFSSGTASDFSISCSLSRNSASNLIRMTIRPQSSSVTIRHNHGCSVAIDGRFTFA